MSTLTTRSLSQPKAFTGICINIQNFTPATNQCSWRKLHEKFKSKSSQITLEYFRSFLLVPFAESLGRVSPQVCPPWVMECNGIPCRESMEVLKVDPRAPGGFHSSRRGGRSVTTGMTCPVFTRLSPGFHHVSLGTSWSCQALEYEPAGDDVECWDLKCSIASWLSN